jgi:chromosome segregation ATPase
MTDAIKAAAGQLAAAKLEAEQAGTALTATDAAVAKVRERIAVLEAERAEIVGARKVGRTSPKQGARLAELAADIEGLAEIHAEAAVAHSAAATEFTHVNQSMVAAEYVLANASDNALLGNPKDIATDLDRRLSETLNEIAGVARRLEINRASWFPTAVLANQVRRPDLERGGI